MSAARVLLLRPGKLAAFAVVGATALAATDGINRESSPFRAPFRFLRLNTVHADAPAAASDKQRLVIVGGGAAGIGVATQVPKLLKSDPAAKVEIMVLEPSDQHFYQPGWTLVGCEFWDCFMLMTCLDQGFC